MGGPSRERNFLKLITFKLVQLATRDKPQSSMLMSRHATDRRRELLKRFRNSPGEWRITKQAVRSRQPESSTRLHCHVEILPGGHLLVLAEFRPPIIQLKQRINGRRPEGFARTAPGMADFLAARGASGPVLAVEMDNHFLLGGR